MALVLDASRVTQLARFVEKRGELISFILVILVLLQGFAVSIAKPLWLDELFTATFARFRDPAAIASAVKKAADPIPPAFYILEGGLSTVIPVDAIALRLPAVVGTACAAAGLFAFLRPAVGSLSALIGTAFLFLTVAFKTYAAEARPYGLLLGCVAGAALAWKSAGKSRAHAAALACCLTLASAIHYYSVFVIFAFLSAEALLALRLRRLRILPLVATGMTTIPLILQWPFLTEAREVFMPNFWGKSQPKALVEIYQHLVPRLWFVLPILTALLLFEKTAYSVVSPKLTLKMDLPRRYGKFCSTDQYQAIILGGCLSLLLPVVAVTATWIMRGGISPRYVLPTVLGLAISFAFCSTKLSFVSRLVLLLAVCLSAVIQCAFSLKRAWTVLTGAKRPSVTRQINSLDLFRAGSESPLVLTSADMFLELSIDSPTTARDKICFLADRKHAVRIVGADSVDVAFLRLKDALPLNVVDYEIFRRLHTRFFILSRGDPYEWQIEQLVRDGCQLSLVRSRQRMKLFWSECNAPSS